MNTNNYQQCTKCIMDTTDPLIYFDSEGICNHCYEFETITKLNWFPNQEGSDRLTSIINRIKLSGKDQEYDCIIGLSGGVDSSFLALKASEWGLKPLVVHVDAGWNSELAVANIEKIVKHCNYDLHTHVVDWEDMRDLHLAYLKAGISNQDVPQDHIFFSSLYHFATKNNIKYILSGGNIATESIFPNAWHGSAMDAINLKAIHKQYGSRKLKQYKTISFFENYVWYPIVKGMRTIRPLNYMPYEKELAIKELEQTIGWQSYGRKHGESVFTKIFQNYYLPKKFGYDKRIPHLSSLIVSGQITRKQAISKMDEPLYEPKELEIDINYFCKKLRISRNEYAELLNTPIHSYQDFNNWDSRYKLLKRIQAITERVLNKRIKIFS